MMKGYKKFLVAVLSLIMAVSALTACGKGGSTQTSETPAAKETEQTSETASEASSEVISDESGTLKMYGPGLFASVGETGTTDMITGVTRPGYNKLIERWNELYPNVKLEIEPIPWDNWKAAIQTAALSGEYDILIHGNGNADFCLDLSDYIKNDTEVSESLRFYPYRRTPENMAETRPYGLSYTLNPVLAVIDKQIMQDYDVELPDENWTLDDLTALAEKTTGTNPVSGQQTYGISMIAAASGNKNYILMGRAFDNKIFKFGTRLTDTQVSFDTDKTVEVFDYLANLGKYSSPDYLEGLDLANAYTKDNNIAMIWAEDVYNVYNTINAAGLTDRFMFLPLPKIKEGDHQGITSSNVGDLNIAIAKDCDQPDLAWAFLKFLDTDPEVLQWLIDTNSIPANVNASSLLYDVMPPEYADAIATTITTSPERYNSSASEWYDSTWFGTFQSDIVVMYDQLLKGVVTSKDVTETIQKNIEDYLGSIK